MSERERDYCINLAVREGLKAGALAAVLSGSAVFGAHKYWPWFRKSLGIR